MGKAIWEPWQVAPPTSLVEGFKGYRARTQRRFPGLYFAFGLLSGGAMGLALLLVLPAAAPGESRVPVLELASPKAAGARFLPASAPLPAIEVAIARHERESAALPLRVTGAEDLNGVRVVLREVPERASLSRGERSDAHTWVLRLQDLEDLHLSLHEGAPRSFAMVVEVASAGAPIAQTTARVRVEDVEAPAPAEEALPASNPRVRTQAALPMRATPLGRETGLAQQAPSPGKMAKPWSGPATGESRAGRAQPRPEGLRALGGPVSDQPAVDAQRQVWWKLPDPPWTLFSTGAAR